MVELIIKYRRNNKERYTECKPKTSCFAFDVVHKILENTKEDRLEVLIEKVPILMLSERTIKKGDLK